MCGVSRRISIRVRLHDHTEARPQRQLDSPDRLSDARSYTALNSAELRVGHPGRGTGRGLADVPRARSQRRTIPLRSGRRPCRKLARTCRLSSGRSPRSSSRCSSSIRRFVPRVRDDQEHDVDLPVAQLQRQPAFHRLGVAKARLTLASRSPPTQNEQRVPRPAVARNRQRHLRSPERVAAADVCAKSFERAPAAPASRAGSPSGNVLSVDLQADCCCRARTPDRLSGCGARRARSGRTGLWDMSAAAPAVRWLMPPSRRAVRIGCRDARAQLRATRRPWSAGSLPGRHARACQRPLMHGLPGSTRTAGVQSSGRGSLQADGGRARRSTWRSP